MKIYTVLLKLVDHGNATSGGKTTVHCYTFYCNKKSPAVNPWDLREKEKKLYKKFLFVKQLKQYALKALENKLRDYQLAKLHINSECKKINVSHMTTANDIKLQTVYAMKFFMFDFTKGELRGNWTNIVNYDAKTYQHNYYVTVGPDDSLNFKELNTFEIPSEKESQLGPKQQSQSDAFQQYKLLVFGGDDDNNMNTNRSHISTTDNQLGGGINGNDDFTSEYGNDMGRLDDNEEVHKRKYLKYKTKYKNLKK